MRARQAQHARNRTPPSEDQPNDPKRSVKFRRWIQAQAGDRRLKIHELWDNLCADDDADMDADARNVLSSLSILRV
jgi:hypothetical protein